VIDSVLTHTDIEYTSPFKSYYFSKERFEHARAEYLSFLSSLRVFVKALREYKGKSGNNEILNIQDLIDFVDIHEKNDVKLNDESPFASARNAVNLLSSHKAKGLEFDTVFVLSCQDEVWAGRGMIKKISLPINLPLDPAGDTEDDQLRLFYVALTRAKRNLYLTSYRVKDDGGQSMKLRFLTPPENVDDILKYEALKKIYTPESIEGKTDESSSIFTPETHELLTASWLLYHTPLFLGEEQELLRSLLEGYQLSVTHLNNFLNVTKGGPQLFLEQNLLRFPQAKSPSGSYGSAIHKTLERISIQQKFNGTLPDIEGVVQWFKEYMNLERLSKSDARIYQERGIEALKAFYAEKKGEFAVEDKTEVNFKEQGVIVEGGEIPAHLTGKIDRILTLPGGYMEVHDYKTGKAKAEWKPEGEYEKIKLYEYERQLIFYKILVEHSRDYGHQYKVNRGVLEFVEPMNNGHVADLILDIDAGKVERVKKLVSIVYTKIMNLDFPDVSKYSQDVEGIQAFEEDLLSKN
jgi:DNA helicase-2/ATP-dependent DNA helicase PcrA